MHKKIKDRFRKILKLDYLQKQLRRKTKTKKKKKKKKCKSQKAFYLFAKRREYHKFNGSN